MVQLTLLPDSDSDQFSQLPLPLQIAANFDFPLAYEMEHYSIQDWIKGVAETDNPRDFWQKLKKRIGKANIQLYTPCLQLKYKASNGKFYKMDFTTAEGLFFLTGRMDTNTGKRDQVLRLMAKSTVFVDWARKHPEQAAVQLQQYAAQNAPKMRFEDYNRARLAGRNHEQAKQAAVLREQLRDANKNVSAARKSHGARRQDYQQLNQLDSEIATGKTPGEWRQTYKTKRNPQDYHGTITNIALLFVKNKSVELYDKNNAVGVEQMAAETRALQSRVDDLRDSLASVLDALPLLPAPGPEQLRLSEGGEE